MFSTEKILYLDSQTLQHFMAVWEEAFKVSHPAVPAAQLPAIRARVEDALMRAKDLTCVKDQTGGILAFMYIQGQRIELLCVAPGARGQGIEQQLTAYAISAQKAKFVEVSEESAEEQAFFEGMGFKAVERLEQDFLGNALPVLRMRLAT